MPGSASIDGATSPAPPQGDRGEGTGVLVNGDEANSGDVENALRITRSDNEHGAELVDKATDSASDDGQAGTLKPEGTLAISTQLTGQKTAQGNRPQKDNAMPESASIDRATSPSPPQGDSGEGTGVLVKRDEAKSDEFVEKLENAGEVTRSDKERGAERVDKSTDSSASDDGQAGAFKTAG